ncbi:MULTISPECIES: hypothetical protein [Streptomyces]|uniref:hypothetical protein n=1 Tax=Streptomyces TaxID=1883 RepID=UPI000F79F47D|nr:MULTISPECIES: hypothetical protein [Streptomyces]RST08789.1 hypothetical protein EF910_00675 [Streptomyces sp. WAC07149]
MGTNRAVFESVAYSARCQDCGGRAQWWGVQVLEGGRLRWDTECSCTACGFTLAVCGGELPAGLRSRMLAEHGSARLRVEASAPNAVVMRVLRAVLGVGLGEVRAVLSGVLAGTHSGTLPEMELLARRLRAAGIDAVAGRPSLP